MRLIPFALTAACVVWAGGLAAEDQRARTADGKDVVLRADGTWAYLREYKKDKGATEVWTGKRGTYAVSLRPEVWRKQDKQRSDPPERDFTFAHKDGDIGAVVNHERLETSAAGLKKMVTENMRAIDKDAKVVLDETRTVNGKEVLCLAFDVTIDGTKFTFFGYYHTGGEGTTQLVTWTGQKLFKELRPEMEAFLNGFELVKKKD